MTEEEARIRWNTPAADMRIRDLERLLFHYITHVGICEGVTFLETKYRALFPGTHEEWDDLRQMGDVTQ